MNIISLLVIGICVGVLTGLSVWMVREIIREDIWIVFEAWKDLKSFGTFLWWTSLPVAPVFGFPILWVMYTEKSFADDYVAPVSVAIILLMAGMLVWKTNKVLSSAK